MATTHDVPARDDVQYEEYPALPYAGLGLRLVAGILDFIFLGSIFLLFFAVAGLYLLVQTDWGNESDFTNAEQWTAIGIVASFAVVIPIYFTAFWWWRGQSVGQMAVRIAVTDRDGYHIGPGQAFLRMLLWPFSVLPLGIGLLPIFFDKESRALHDMLTSTVVLELP
jgi:uncharacterized RDD family membrane protein YckC